MPSISFQDGPGNKTVPDVSPVYVDKKAVPPAAGEFPRSEVRPDIQTRSLLPRLEQRSRHFLPEEIGQANHLVPGRGKAHHSFPVAVKPEFNIGKRQRPPGNGVNDMFHLGTRASQEFPPGRYVVKKVSHHDACAGWAPGLIQGNKFSARKSERVSGQIFSRPAGYLHPRHRGNTRQRLPAKSQGPHGKQVRDGSDLARGMPLNAEEQIISGHPGPVVSHLDLEFSSPLNGDQYAAGSGIDAVVQQFPDHGGRPLHHLSCSDLGCHIFGEYPDIIHSTSSLRWIRCGLRAY